MIFLNINKITKIYLLSYAKVENAYRMFYLEKVATCE